MENHAEKGKGIVMKKRILCLFLALFLLLLPGCGQEQKSEQEKLSGSEVERLLEQEGEREKLFCSWFKQLQEQAAMHVRNEQYYGKSIADIKLLAVRNEWRSGEDFYWEDDDGARYLSCGDERWTIDPPQHTQWKQRDYRIESFSNWWNESEPERFLTGEVTIRREGAYIVLEQYKDHGSNNCTLSKQTSTNTFYVDEDGGIVRITRMTVTYNGTQVAPGGIHSVSKAEYYITAMDVDEAHAKIQAQYQTVMR